MKHVHILRVEIAPYETIKERTLAIAQGEYKPLPSELKIWFSSIESLAQVLSTRNRLLLELIAQAKSKSMTELAQQDDTKVISRGHLKRWNIMALFSSFARKVGKSALKLLSSI